MDIWQFKRQNLRLQTVLGEGHFGKVWKAEADNLRGFENSTVVVAVKTAKENAAKKELNDFLEEISIMKEIGPHPNVVTLYGICTEKEPYLLLMEFIQHGKLLTYLREHRSRQCSLLAELTGEVSVNDELTAKDLTKFALGVAKGMEYIVSKGVSFLKLFKFPAIFYN